MYVDYDKDMKDKVLAWRKENNVRKLTDYQAKRFSKHYLMNRS